MKGVIYSVLLALLLSACAAIGQGPDVLRQPAAITIYRDTGGVVGQYFSDVLAELNTTRQVRIEGECTSACTAWLRLGSRVCVGPHARLGFHKFTGNGDAGAYYVYRSLYLPSDFQQWVDANVVDTQVVWMEHGEILQHLKACI